MALRPVCGLGATLKRSFNLPPRRCFHVSAQRRPSHDLAGMFSGIFSAHPTPDKINTLMNMISTEAPQNNVTSFSLLCRTFTDRMDRWSIKGLRIAPKDNGARRRSVVLVSGIQAYERIPIGVNLFVAAALSRSPIEGVEVTFFPVMKPKEYELEWQHEQAKDLFKSYGGGSTAKFSLEEHEGGVEGPLRNYVLKRSNNFIDVGMDLTALGSTLRLKSNSLTRPLSRAQVFMQGLTPDSDFPLPKLAGPGEQTLFGTLISPPTVVLELRDKHKSLEEDQISSCGEQVLSAIEKLIADTDGARGLVM